MPVRTLGILTAAVLLATTGALIVSPAAAAGGGISGQATSALGAPLEGVQVVVSEYFGGQSAETLTSADGAFAVGDLPDGQYVVCFSAAEANGGESATGYVDTCWRDVDATDGYSSSDVELVTIAGGSTVSGIVQELPSAGGVTGTVTDALGTPLSGAKVTASAGPGSPPTKRGDSLTDENGHYTIDQLPPSELYTVCVSAAGVTGGSSTTGYLDECLGGGRAQFGATPFGEPETFPVVGAEVAPVAPIALDAAARLSGTLTDKDGAPIAGVRVYGWGQGTASVTATDITDSAGHFLLSVDNDNGSANAIYHGTRIPAQSYQVLFSTHFVPDYVTQYYKRAFSPYSSGWSAPTLVAPAAGTPTVITDYLDHSSSLGGTVTDSGGTPLVGVPVWVYHDDAYVTEATTGAGGKYTVGRLPQGEYEVCFRSEYVTGGSSAAGYFDRCSGNTPTSAPETVVLGYNEDRTDVGGPMPSASGIAGTVVDGDGQPLSSVGVTVRQGSNTVTTTNTAFGTGTYLARRLQPGSYTVCFQRYFPSPEAQCYDGVAPGGDPTPVITTAGSVTTGINAQLGAPTPDETAPVVTVVSPPTLFRSSRAVQVGVSYSDDKSGVADYDVRYRYADWNDASFSDYLYPDDWQFRSGSATGASFTFTGVPGRTYCFSARARDESQNVSGFSPERCTVVALDDRALTRSAGWTLGGDATAYERTVSRTSTYGAKLTLRGAKAAHAAVLVTTCRTCGTMGVYLNGRLLKKVSTYSSVSSRRVVLVQPGFSYRDATITLKLLDTSRTLIVDGLAVTRK